MQSKEVEDKFKGISSAYLVNLPTISDDRGRLTAIESGINIPFDIKRCYFIHDIKMPRGGHAHRETSQIIVAVSGDCKVCLSDGTESKVFNLNSPSIGLCFDPMVWIEIPKFSLDATVLVLASTHYDSKKTIRDWQEYLEAIEQIKLNN